MYRFAKTPGQKGLYGGAIYIGVLGAELASYHLLASRILKWLIGSRKMFVPLKQKNVSKTLVYVRGKY